MPLGRISPLNTAPLTSAYVFIAFNILILVALSLPSLAQAQTPQVTLVAVEVTQAIQKIDPTDPWNGSNTVPLIANRQTYVRAYFDVKQPSSGSISFSGVLVGKLNGTPLVSQPSAAQVTVNFNENNQLTIKRNDLSKSLYFSLPDDWVSKAGELKLSVQVENSVACTDSQPQDCANRWVTVELLEPMPLRLRLVLLVEEDVNGNLPISTSTDTDLIKSWLMRAYPIQNLGIGANSSFQIDMLHLGTTLGLCDDANAPLADYRKRKATDPSNPMDDRTRVVGLFSNANHSGNELGGCAVGALPFGSNVDDPNAIASVPTGFPIPNSWPSAGNWDTDGSYADWYTGHEMAHTFGFRHLNYCSAPSLSGYDSNPFPPPYTYNGEISGAQGSVVPYVGFDVGHLGTPIPLPGDKWHDIRTYCDKRWISHTVYEWIRDALDLENPTAVARVIKRKFQTRPSLIPDLPRRLDRFIEFKLQRPKANDGPDGPKPSGVIVSKGDFLAVVVTVNLTRKTAAFHSTARVRRAEIVPEVAEPEATLRLFGDNGQVLGEKSLIIRRNMRMEKTHDETGLIYDAIALPPNKTVKSVKLFLSGKEKPAAVVPISKAPPEVRPAKYPFHTVEYEAGQLRLHWSAKDPDTDVKLLRYTIEVSFNQGKIWHTLAVSWSKQQIVIGVNELEILSGNKSDTLRAAQIKLIASDGFNNSAPMIKKLELGKIEN